MIRLSTATLFLLAASAGLAADKDGPAELKQLAGTWVLTTTRVLDGGPSGKGRVVEIARQNPKLRLVFDGATCSDFTEATIGRVRPTGGDQAVKYDEVSFDLKADPKRLLLITKARPGSKMYARDVTIRLSYKVDGDILLIGDTTSADKLDGRIAPLEPKKPGDVVHVFKRVKEK